MVITALEKISARKYRVCIDDDEFSDLTSSEVKRYRLAEGKRLDREEFDALCADVLKRAKLRAMHLLEDLDRTEKQLSEKLTANGFSDDIVQNALDYVKSFGYVNDDAYVRRFAESRLKSRSRKEICALLYKKGVDLRQAEEILNEVSDRSSEQEAIRTLLRKKRWDPENMTPEEMKKAYGFLVRKGFRYEDIRQVIQVPHRKA